MSIRARILLAAGVLFVLAVFQARTGSHAAPSVPSPFEQFGARVGDDYFLATYAQLEAYWKRVDRESDRVQLEAIGTTEEGRTQWMAIVSAPENIARLQRYKDISRRLALGAALTDGEARALAEDGKAVVWIDGGLHADEVLGAQQLIQLVYELASGSDQETLRVLRDVIVLVVHANPDGHALVADWYMRQREPRQRTLAGLPRAYQKYVGHDNNRDFYLSSQAETANMNRVLYREWFPQVVYDHHQPGPDGTVMFAPPFGGPANDAFDPLVTAGVELFGRAMHERFAAEGRRGVTTRNGSEYSMWWNGGLRTTSYFHNQIGLLTETVGSPTPIRIPFVASRQVATADLPHPIAPQLWRFRQSIEYSMSANRAVLATASRHRAALLWNAYVMARRAIDAGRASGPDGVPRAYIVPVSQPDFLTAAKFVDALVKGGVRVQRATAPFTAAGRVHPAGSFVVSTAQAFRAHVVDMFEPQRYPQEDAAALRTPYDITGWTLAMQMGVAFERAFDPVSGSFEDVHAVAPPRGTIAGASVPSGYLLAHRQNDSARVVNRLLDAGHPVFWLRDRSIGSDDGTGSVYVPRSAGTERLLREAAATVGVSAVGIAEPPAGGGYQVQPVRIGLWDQYGGASTSGWIRWVLERFEFPYERVYPQALDRGALAARYDVLILPDEAVPGRWPQAPAEVPGPYRGMTGGLSWHRTVPRLQEFVEDGGTLIAIGDATSLAPSLGVAVSNAAAAEEVRVPGGLLEVVVDRDRPLGYGFGPKATVMFHDSPAFRLTPGSRARVVAFFGAAPVRSGWAAGADRLHESAAVVEARLGAGRVLLFGPEIVFRGQSHGTFKFLFNGIHSAAMQALAALPP